MYQHHQYTNQHGGHANAPVNSGFSRPIVLDDYNSDLNFVVEADGLTGSCLHKEGFEYLWAGARATHGVSSGKVCFEVVVGEKLPVKMPETERTPHVVRIGCSTDFSSLQVGEDEMSYGYGGTGKCSVNNKYFDYGEPYSTNDVIGCYINLDGKSIFFTKNGHYLANAFQLGPETNGAVFYPHVTVKNMKVHVNFGLRPPYFQPVSGYTMIQDVMPNHLVRAVGSPDTRKDCQVIMMVGIPACGKTFWAAKYAKENKIKKFNIIGTNAIMDRMKVMGLTRQRNYHGRWDALIKQATDILNKILKIAEKKHRNYILDQTNVYHGAQKRKMNSFHGFHRIAAVLVNEDEVLKYRTEKREREEGKLVPENAVMEMKANFAVPERGVVFDEVWFVEEDEQSSRRLIERYNKEGNDYKEQELLKRKRSDSVESLQGPPAKDSGHTRNSNSEYSQNNLRHSHQNHHGAHGHSSHNPRPVFTGHSPGAYGAHNPRSHFNPPDMRPQTRFPMSSADFAYGPAYHYPEREPYPMYGQHGPPSTVHDRFMSYRDPSYRYSTPPAGYQYHQNPMRGHHSYESREHYMFARQDTHGYGTSYAYNRQEANPEVISIPETGQSGCDRFEPLTNSACSSIREPVEHDYLPPGPSSHEQREYCHGYQGMQGYSMQYQHRRGSRH